MTTSFGGEAYPIPPDDPYPIPSDDPYASGGAGCAWDMRYAPQIDSCVPTEAPCYTGQQEIYDAAGAQYICRCPPGMYLQGGKCVPGSSPTAAAGGKIVLPAIVLSMLALLL